MKKEKNVYKKVTIYSFICFLLLAPFYQKGDRVPYTNVEYSLTECSACLEFHYNNRFTDNDCENDPSGMPFDSDFYQTYVYDNSKKIITFKSIYPKYKDIKVKVVEWNDDKLIMKVLDSKRNTQYASKYCSVDGNNTYVYEYK